MPKLKDVSEWAGISYAYLSRIKSGGPFGIDVGRTAKRLTGKTLDEIMDMSGAELFEALGIVYMKQLLAKHENGK